MYTEHFDQILEDLVPPCYLYRETGWYRMIASRREQTVIRIMTISSALSLLLITGDTLFLILNHSLKTPCLTGITFLLPLLYLLLIRQRGGRWHSQMSRISVILFFLFFPVSAFNTSTSHFFILTFLIFPLCINFLYQEKKAFLLNGAYILYCGLVFLLEILIQPDTMSYGHNPRFVFVMVFLYFLIYVINLFLVKEYKNHLKIIIRKVIYDSETGLPKKRVLQNCGFFEKEGILMIVSLENFTDLRTTFGYEKSEEVLNQLAEDLKALETEYGYQAFRLKGFDYGLVFPGCTEKDPARLKELMSRLQKRPYRWNTSEVFLRLAAGYTSFSDGESEKILSEADTALMEARRSHQDLKAFHSSREIREKSIESVRLYSTLISNFHDRSLRVHYQPIFSREQQKVVWHELLLRLKGPAGETQSIAPYLSLAGATGLDRSFPFLVLNEALDFIKGNEGFCSVNISVKDALNTDFVQTLIRKEPEIRNAPGTLIFEILEIYEIEDEDILREFISLVHRMGGLIAVDDFGSGYSNYSKILNMPIDILKIDGSLVRNSLHNRRNHLILNNIITLCREAGIRTVAEYVESEGLFHSLSSLGVDYLQGYYIGRPAPRPSGQEKRQAEPVPAADC